MCVCVCVYVCVCASMRVMLMCFFFGLYMKVVHGRLGYMIPYLRGRLITSNWARPFSNPNHYNPLIAQPFSGEVLTVPGLELRLFAAKAPPPP